MKQSTRKYRGFTIFYDIGTYHSYMDENGIRTFLPSHTTIREAKQEIDKHLGPKPKRTTSRSAVTDDYDRSYGPQAKHFREIGKE